jgi:hypothetical protein
VCHQGYFETYSLRDVGVHMNWMEFRPCNLTEWCSETNSIECREMIYRKLEPMLRCVINVHHKDDYC